MALISVGGLATGLDTNQIIDQLVALERRPIDLLTDSRSAAKTKELALQTFNTKLLAFRTAVDSLRTASGVLVRKASSSDGTVATAVAGNGATAGTTTINVTQLARNAIASSDNTVASGGTAVASGAGSFTFRVGSGADQTVTLTAATTLDDLVSAINDLDAGVTASAVNVGTSASPAYKLQLSSDGTGSANDITVVTDDSTLGVVVRQTALDASFTISGIDGAVTRESNTIADLIPGVTLTLLDTGASTITVSTDNEGVTKAVQAVVTAFNDIQNFVTGESVVTQDVTDEDRAVEAGPLAFDGAVRSIMSRLHGLVSEQVEGLPGRYEVLAQLGITTNRDGTLAFDAAKLTAALGTDATEVAELFGGAGSVGGVADRLHEFLTGVTQVGGLLTVRSTAVADEIKRLDKDIATGERHLDAFEANLRARFASLEVLVSSLQSQGAFLQNALGGLT